MGPVNPAHHPDGELRIEERASIGSADGGPLARTLKEWRTLLNTRGYVLHGPTGKEFAISLDAFDGRDESTPIAIYVEWVDQSLLGTEEPTGRPGADGQAAAQTAAAEQVPEGSGDDG